MSYTLTRRLRGVVAAERLADPRGYWHLADWHYARAVAAGADPAALVDAVSHCLTGGHAAVILTDPAQPWNHGRPAAALGATNADIEAVAYAAQAHADAALNGPQGDAQAALGAVAAMLARVLPAAPRFA